MVKRIAVTGGAGQIAYSLLFAIAQGHLFGQKESIILSISDLKEMAPVLEGVAMELEDCAYPLLKKIEIHTDPLNAFNKADCVFLVGAKPRGPGMERKDLLQDNGKIFISQGRALNEAASRDVKVLVVGNPCNTNCLIAMHHAPDLPKGNFHAMTRLDHNRALAHLAKKAKVEVTKVKNVIIWGNHSSTQVPDWTHATIEGAPAAEKIHDEKWLKGQFIDSVQKRGAAIIAARGKSSAASAASSAMDAMRDLYIPTLEGQWFSSAIATEGNPYGIPEDLVFGFPCILQNGKCSIVPNLEWDAFISEKIALTIKELQEEKACIQNLLKDTSYG